MAAPKRLTAEQLAVALYAPTGYMVGDVQRLQRALTHASARSAHAGLDYERFEFLGDRVLGLVVADMLLSAYPDAVEGELSLRLNALVNAETLSEIAEQIGLSDMIRAGADVHKLAGRKRVNLRADALESLIAVLYLDGGLEVARAFIHRYWQPRAQAMAKARRDPKTELQEWAHQATSSSPSYVIEGREGPDHDPVFTISVTVGTLAAAQGKGRSRREAEQAAATAMLLRENVWHDEEKTI
ncbi:ribonuclease III [Aquamicrobium segne]|uniref:Ribonuclease 3 n=1 Tax=Aquamicrobium segne TaxID=469547 RepID=A0ABW0GXV9_9HYPH